MNLSLLLLSLYKDRDDTQRCLDHLVFNANGACDKQLGIVRRKSAIERAPIMNAPSARLRILMECKVDDIIAQTSKTTLTKYREMKNLYTEGEAKQGGKRKVFDADGAPSGSSSIGVRQSPLESIGYSNSEGWRQENAIEQKAPRRDENDAVDCQPNKSIKRTHHPSKSHEPDSVNLKTGYLFSNKGLEEGRRDYSSRGNASYFNKEGIDHIKGGLDDTIDKLMLPAVLRVFVPDTMCLEICPEKAFRRYCETPPSLIKIEHERHAAKAAQRYASNLRFEGYTYIRQLLPVTRRTALFHRLGFSQVTARL